MGWEKRRGQLFYYEKRREGKRVRSIYLGRGARAVEASRAAGISVPAEVMEKLEKEASYARAEAVAQRLAEAVVAQRRGKYVAQRSANETRKNIDWSRYMIKR